MPGHRVLCAYCKTSYLSRDIGRHILRQHPDQLFTGSNLRDLHRDKYLTKPLQLSIDNETYHFCLADESCIRHSENATRHFKGKAEKHKDVLLSFREKFPNQEKTEEKTEVQSTFSEKEKKILQDFIAVLYSEHPDHLIDKKTQKVFVKLGVTAELSSVQSLYPHLFEKPEEEEAPPSEPKEDDILPLVVEKPLTKEEVIKKLFTEKELEEASRGALTGKKQSIPELEQMKRGPKPVYGSQPSISTPPPPPPPSDEKDEKMKQMEAQLLEYEKFSKMTPWQKLVNANPTCSIQDLIRLAASSGIKPDAGASFKIVGNTKRTN